MNDFINSKIFNVLQLKKEESVRIQYLIDVYSKIKEKFRLRYQHVSKKLIKSPQSLYISGNGLFQKIYLRNFDQSYTNLKYCFYIDSLKKNYTNILNELKPEYFHKNGDFITILRKSQKNKKIELVTIERSNTDENTIWAISQKDTIPFENLHCINKMYKFIIKNPITGKCDSYYERRIDENIFK
jgi:hypothetical protein